MTIVKNKIFNGDVFELKNDVVRAINCTFAFPTWVVGKGTLICERCTGTQFKVLGPAKFKFLRGIIHDIAAQDWHWQGKKADETLNGAQWNKCQNGRITKSLIVAAKLTKFTLTEILNHVKEMNPKLIKMHGMPPEPNDKVRAPEDMINFYKSIKCIMDDCLVVGPANESGSCALIDDNSKHCQIINSILLWPGNVCAAIAGGAHNLIQNCWMYGVGNVATYLDNSYYKNPGFATNRILSNRIWFFKPDSKLESVFYTPHRSLRLDPSNIVAAFDPVEKAKEWLSKADLPRRIIF
jgi:hypothetical protein